MRLGVSAVQASRLDRGLRNMRADDVRSLAEWYDVPAVDVPRLLELATESRRRAWWEQEKTRIPDPAYRALIGMEQAAEFIGEFSSGVVPGLLQIPAYARASASGGMINVDARSVEVAVEVRMRRQEILRRPRPPRLWVVIDESVLARVTGGGDVMRAQLAHLADIAERPGVTVQVIGFEFGSHLGINSGFILVEAGEGLPDLIYVEGLRGKAEFTDDVETERYREVWQHLTAVALSPRHSRERIEWYLGRLAPRASPSPASHSQEEERG